MEDEWGPAWALASGLAGVAGSFAISQLAQKQAEPESEFEAVPFQSAERATETVHN